MQQSEKLFVAQYTLKWSLTCVEQDVPFEADEETEFLVTQLTFISLASQVCLRMLQELYRCREHF
jgi:hypothetical protein